MSDCWKHSKYTSVIRNPRADLMSMIRFRLTVGTNNRSVLSHPASSIEHMFDTSLTETLMRTSLTLLSAVLKKLSIPTKVDSIDDRKTIQKAIFLAREAGVDLGYQYNWYLMGKYSPGLAQDYFNLDHSVEVKVLHPKIENRLDALRGLFSVRTRCP